MPQTKEAISHAQAAGVPIIFLQLTKIDLPNSDAEKIKGELAEINMLVEDWGGKYQSNDISAKEGTGVQELLEKVLLESEMLALTANPNRNAQGTVVEASLDKGKGFSIYYFSSERNIKSRRLCFSWKMFWKSKSFIR